MRFSISKKKLQKYIQPLSMGLASKNTMPILTNYKIQADSDKNLLKFTVTNLELTIVAHVNAEVHESGEVLTIAKELNEIVGLMPDSTINFEYIEDDFKIFCEDIKYNLHVADLSLYPLIPNVDLENSIKCKGELLRKMILHTEFAVSNDINRPIFQGIYWDIRKDSLLMAASDGKRFAEVIYPYQSNVEEEIDSVIPPKGLDFISKIVDSNDEVEFTIDKNKVVFRLPNYIVISNVLKGTYPSYQKVFEKKADNYLFVNKKEFMSAVKRTSLLASEDSYKIKMTLDDSTLTLSSENRDMGDAVEKIKDFDYNADPVVLGFNYRFLTSIINAIETEEVKMLVGDGELPVLFFNTDDFDEYQAQYLIMPLLIKH